MNKFSQEGKSNKSKRSILIMLHHILFETSPTLTPCCCLLILDLASARLLGVDLPPTHNPVVISVPPKWYLCLSNSHENISILARSNRWSVSKRKVYLIITMASIATTATTRRRQEKFFRKISPKALCLRFHRQKQRPSVSYTGALSSRSPYRQQFRHQPTAKEEAPVALLEKTVKSSSHLRH